MRSFDIHVHQDREGRMRVSVTLPDGTRSPPLVVSAPICVKLAELCEWITDETARVMEAPQAASPKRPTRRLTLHRGDG